MLRTVVVLSKAVTHSGPYVTGIDINTGRWVRLVKSEICEYQPGLPLHCKPLQYENGQICQILDVIETDVEVVSDGVEPDMVKYVGNSLPKKLMSFNLKDVLAIHPSEKQDDLLGNRGNKVTDQEYKELKYRLALVEVSNLSIDPKGLGEHPSMEFWYNGIHYEDMHVADNDFTTLDQHVHMDNAVLVLAVSDDSRDGHHFKFVARVFNI